MGLLLVFLCHSSGSDMIKILKPLEVGDRHTTAINKHVRCTNDSSALEYLLSFVGRGAVGSLEDGLDLYLLGIAHVQNFFYSSGYHAISLL